MPSALIIIDHFYPSVDSISASALQHGAIAKTMHWVDQAPTLHESLTELFAKFKSTTYTPNPTGIIMSYHSPHQSQSQFQFNPSTPPPPPPKPSAHSSGQATPQAGPPRPPPPGQSLQGADNRYSDVYQPGHSSEAETQYMQGPGDGWLPEILKDKT
jgi:hypothetical protein